MRAEIIERRAAAALRGRDPRDAAATACCATGSAITRARDLHGLLRVAVFAPDDLELVKGGPAARREYLDELLGDARGALRRGARRLRTGAEATQRVVAVGRARRRRRRATLDVFDEQLVHAGGRAGARAGCSSSTGSGPAVNAAYATLAADDGRPVAETYEAEWAPEPLGDRRRRRGRGPAARGARGAAGGPRSTAGVTLVGPHRDELAADDRRARRAHPGVAGRAAHARARVAARRPRRRARAHRARRRCCCSTTCSASSTRAARARWSRNLPAGQTLLTTAGAIPRRRRARSGAAHPRRPGRATSEPMSDARPSRRRAGARCATRSRRSVASSGCPRPTCSRRSRAAWPAIVGRALAPHASVRSYATACARSRSTDRAGRPSCGTPNSQLVERAAACCGPGVVTSIRVVVVSAAAVAGRSSETAPERPFAVTPVLVHWSDRIHPL